MSSVPHPDRTGDEAVLTLVFCCTVRLEVAGTDNVRWRPTDRTSGAPSGSKEGGILSRSSLPMPVVPRPALGGETARR